MYPSVAISISLHAAGVETYDMLITGGDEMSSDIIIVGLIISYNNI